MSHGARRQYWRKGLDSSVHGPHGPCPPPAPPAPRRVPRAFSSSRAHACLPPASRVACSFVQVPAHVPPRAFPPKPWRPPPSPSVSAAGGNAFRAPVSRPRPGEDPLPCRGACPLRATGLAKVSISLTLSTDVSLGPEQCLACNRRSRSFQRLRGRMRERRGTAGCIRSPRLLWRRLRNGLPAHSGRPSHPSPPACPLPPLKPL